MFFQFSFFCKNFVKWHQNSVGMDKSYYGMKNKRLAMSLPRGNQVSCLTVSDENFDIWFVSNF